MDIQVTMAISHENSSGLKKRKEIRVFVLTDRRSPYCQNGIKQLKLYSHPHLVLVSPVLFFTFKSSSKASISRSALSAKSQITSKSSREPIKD